MIKNRKIQLIVLAFLVLTVLTTMVSCSKNDDEFVITKIKYDNLTIPSDLLEGQLQIEWLGGSYSVIKPTLIYFHGEMPNMSNKRVSFTLDEEEYTDDTYSNNRTRFNDRDLSNIRELYYYWDKAGFNVGIFHYEQFADDTSKNILSKIYDNSNLSYKNGEETITSSNSDLSHSLVEVFVATYLNEFTDRPLRGEEIRFIGNGVGANFALAVVEYMEYFFAKGEISGIYMPRRVTLTDPYLSEDNIDLNIEWKNDSINDFTINDTSIDNALEYTAKSVKALNRKGVIFEYIESDEKYEDFENEDYDILVENTAMLMFRETYSQNFSADYLALNRISLDWYLYSINGSDRTLGFDTDPNIRKDFTYPILDNYERDKARQSLVYGLSAWTPTTYTKAVVGHIFIQVKPPVDGESETFYLERFQTENNQKSDITSPFIAGYAFLDTNKDGKINNGFGIYLANVEITFKYRDDHREYKVYTDETGFYKFNIKESAYDTSNENYIDINVLRPSFRYKFTNVIKDSFYNDYMKMNMATLESTNDSVFLSSNTKRGPKIMNVGFFED